ncbi:uncharacterized protein LOC135463013 [Liolophura sinensis]|uniref:uncharacterized protein LOC135463013 n=1 Tax=Liolophura sinensis TaxID=3198878 RepID=UPI003159466C
MHSPVSCHYEINLHLEKSGISYSRWAYEPAGISSECHHHYGERRFGYGFPRRPLGQHWGVTWRVTWGPSWGYTWVIVLPQSGRLFHSSQGTSSLGAPPKNSPANALTSVLPPKQNSLSNGKLTNGKSLDNDSPKEAPLEEILEQVKGLVHQLRDLEEYHRGEGMQIQKALGDFYWKQLKFREQIGDLMCKEGYGETSVKMLKTLNTMGIFKNDDIWFPTYYAYNTMWNFSDASAELAKTLAEADVVRLLSLNCGHKPYINAIHSKNVYYVIKASLSILHNIARNPDVKHYFKEHKTSEVIRPFIENSDEMLKALAMLTLAYVVDEDENSTLIDETGVIKCVCEWLSKALSNPKRRYRGFTPQELTQGLDKLAVNDSNKIKIVEEGALQSFLIMLQHDDIREESMAARAIWTLSFDKNVRQKILEMTELIDMLEKMTQSPDENLSKSCIGALWVIREEADNPNRPRSAGPSKSHVFISYSWSDRVHVMEIADRLKKEGYNIWIDVEQMGGSTLQAMAEATENATVVLICMSEKYKQSPNCRTEAEYTFQLRKDYIPIMMQKRYRPDGWLGLILGAKLYIDFSGKYPFEKSVNGLLKELRGRGKGVPNGPRRGETVDLPNSHEPTLHHHFATHNASHPHQNSAGHIKTREEVGKWLHHVGLGHLSASFTPIDGRMLGQIREMRREAPEFFYQSLERRLGMSFADILLFTDALDGLTT